MSVQGDLQNQAGEVKLAVERWLHRADDSTVKLFLSDDDKFRLLRLKVWSIRWSIPVDEILDILIPILRKVVEGKGRQWKRLNKGLGIRITTLTGEASEKILIREIDRRYPQGENVSVLKSAEQDRQLIAEKVEEEGGEFAVRSTPKLITSESIDDYVERYATRVQKEREEFDKASSEKWRRRKAYRGNPWR